MIPPDYAMTVDVSGSYELPANVTADALITALAGTPTGKEKKWIDGVTAACSTLSGGTCTLTGITATRRELEGSNKRMLAAVGLKLSFSIAFTLASEVKAFKTKVAASDFGTTFTAAYTTEIAKSAYSDLGCGVDAADCAVTGVTGTVVSVIIMDGTAPPPARPDNLGPKINDGGDTI